MSKLQFEHGCVFEAVQATHRWVLTLLVGMGPLLHPWLGRSVGPVVRCLCGHMPGAWISLQLDAGVP